MIMMTIYSVILVLSAAFAAWAGERVFVRVLREMNAPDELSQIMVVLAMLAFFIVVAMPAAVMIAAFLLLTLGLLRRARRFTPLHAVCIPVAALLGVYGLSDLPGHWPDMLPPMAWLAVAGLTWVLLLAPLPRIQPSQWAFSAAVIFSAMPLLAAPVLFQAHSSIALDFGILSASLLGGILSPYASQPATAMLRFTSAFMLGVLMLQAVHYGAWPLALASAAIWAVAMAVLSRHPVFEAEVARD